ncbi:MAG: flippase-like domain-containing protein, partial [Syntrophales bacterium]|nr:flippase-like domain-containing protein [Syntrophales bacterium]
PLLKACALSQAFGLGDALAIYAMFQAFGFNLPFTAPFVLLVILMIGIAIPAGPGFVGNWHYFCILGLSLYGVPKTAAFSFAVLYHFLSIGIVLLLGFIFLPHNRFSFADLKAVGKRH